MNKIQNIFLFGFFCALIGLTSCASVKKSTREQSSKLPSGLVINWTEFGNGKRVVAGDAVTIHYTGKLENDTVFDSSIKRGQPITFVVGSGRVIKGWEEALPKMFEGDKAQLIIPPDLAYGTQATGPIPANATLKFDIEIIKSITPRQPDPWILTNADTITLPSGLKYIILKKGNGASVAYGRKVKVHYIGYLESGKVFDSSVDRGQPIAIEAGMGKVIKGWDEALLKLKKSDRARLIIPPSLGYGDRQIGPIPANSTLIFDIEILDVNE